MEKWCYLYSVGKIPFDFCLKPLYKENQHDRHWFCWFNLVLINTTMVLSLYTLFYHASRGNATIGLQSTCMATLMLGVRRTFLLEFRIKIGHSLISAVFFILCTFHSTIRSHWQR